MKVAAEKAHRKEEIRGQKQDHQAARKRDVAGCKARDGDNGAERRAAVGDEVHDGDGVELHRQHTHCDLPELLGLAVHLLVARGVRLIDFQSREPLQVFEEGVAHLRVLAPVFRQELFGPRLDRRDGNGDQRHTHEQDGRGGQVDEGQDGEQSQRGEHTVKNWGRYAPK